jgi:hypothetical protein
MLTDARKTWRTLEPIHSMVYFVPEGDEEYGRLGLRLGRMGYFASRAAALGPASPELVTATFYNFHPALVRSVIPEAWELARPADVSTARLVTVDRALRRVWGELVSSPEIAAAAEMARQAATNACDHLEGRPLFAAHASIVWPTEPHLVLWHAQTLLREFRGDGHLAALVLEGLGGLDALITHAAAGDVSAATLRASRAWSTDEWDAGVQRLHERGIVHEDGSFTAEGRAQRDRIEEATDRAAVIAYESLGSDGCERLRSLARPFSKLVVEGGLLTPRHW